VSNHPSPRISCLCPSSFSSTSLLRSPSCVASLREGSRIVRRTWATISISRSPIIVASVSAQCTSGWTDPTSHRAPLRR
jgi:hypothetical protein